MADMVKRLRENAVAVPHDVYSWFNPLLNEAADEIERLQFSADELNEIRQWYNTLTDINPVFLAERDHTIAKKISGILEQKADR